MADEKSTSQSRYKCGLGFQVQQRNCTECLAVSTTTRGQYHTDTSQGEAASQALHKQ